MDSLLSLKFIRPLSQFLTPEFLFYCNNLGTCFIWCSTWEFRSCPIPKTTFSLLPSPFPQLPALLHSIANGVRLAIHAAPRWQLCFPQLPVLLSAATGRLGSPFPAVWKFPSGFLILTLQKAQPLPGWCLSSLIGPPAQPCNLYGLGYPAAHLTCKQLQVSSARKLQYSSSCCNFSTTTPQSGCLAWHATTPQQYGLSQLLTPTLHIPVYAVSFIGFVMALGNF